MAEYIDREAALAFQNEVEPLLCRNVVTHDIMSATKDADMVKYLQSIPAADVRPVAKAAWEQVEVRYEDELIDNPVQAVASMFCPNCQRYHNEVYFYGMPTERVNYCPNCGAKMEES